MTDLGPLEEATPAQELAFDFMQALDAAIAAFIEDVVEGEY